MLLIARTDSESGMLISSNIDVADQEFIVGTTTRGPKSLAQVLSDAEATGATSAEVNRLEQDWTASHVMCTFNQGEPKPELDIK
jgi:isocitrate lyase